jgi:MFS family permease
VLSALGVIVAARFCTGLAAGALATIGMTMVGDYLPEAKRAGTIGMLSAVNMIGSVVTLPTAGWVGDAGWRAAFFLYLLAAPVIVLASLRSLPVPVRPAARSRQAVGKRQWSVGLPMGLILLAIAVGIILTIPGIYISFHLATIGLGKASTVGLLMMLNSLIAAVTSAMFGKAWRRSPRAVFCCGFGTMTAGLFLLALGTGYPVVIPALLMMGTGMGLLAPSVMARVVGIVEEGRRGQSVGFANFILAIAPLFGITLLEPLMPEIGTRGVILAIGLLSAISFAAFALPRAGKPVPVPG